MRSPNSLEAGATFARDFRVVRCIGEGGMGVVYEAEQLSTGKKRALKVLSTGGALEADVATRFEREAKVGSRFASEHVVDVIAAGVDEATGLPWLAMELLEGVTLAHYVTARGHIEPSAAFVLIEELCHGLGAAHAAGVVHRDLKPDNVFVAKSQRAGAGDIVKLLDFGIAKILLEVPTTTANMGTPLWMAPEQTQRDGQVSPAADVWALGLVVFFMLAGRSYWLSAAADQASVGTIVREILFDPLDRASARARALGAHPFPADLDAWFSKCVQRDPSRRFTDANEAWAALAPLLVERSGVNLLRVPTAHPALPRSRRGPRWLVAVALCAVVAGLVLASRTTSPRAASDGPVASGTVTIAPPPPAIARTAAESASPGPSTSATVHAPVARRPTRVNPPPAPPVPASPPEATPAPTTSVVPTLPHRM